MRHQNRSYRRVDCDQGSQGLKVVSGFEAENELSENLKSYLARCPELRELTVGCACCVASRPQAPLGSRPLSPCWLRPEELARDQLRGTDKKKREKLFLSD